MISSTTKSTVMNFKEIHIGHLIKQMIVEQEIEMPRICNFLSTTPEEVEKMYNSKSLDTDTLLKWSKLLFYDFFRIYSQHLILYTPSTKGEQPKSPSDSKLPQFRKNIYTQEIIDFILGEIKTGEMTTAKVISDYGIPKTTLYKWIKKHQK